MKRKLARIHHPVRRSIVSAVLFCLSLLNWVNWLENRKHNRRRRYAWLTGILFLLYWGLGPCDRIAWSVLYSHGTLIFLGFYSVLSLLIPDRSQHDTHSPPWSLPSTDRPDRYMDADSDR